MQKLLPHPMISVAITFMWLVLNSFSLGHLLLGSAIALVSGWALGLLHPARKRTRRWDLLVQLFFIVGADIIRSNLSVAWLILTNDRRGARNSEFIELQLELRDRMGLAVLSFIVTATPGSAWIRYTPDTGKLLIHVFDVIDEDEWRNMLKTKYEKRLMEIYE